jgi:tetratricopeptide (TPR) repeat protein
MKKIFFLVLVFPFLGNSQIVDVCECVDLKLSFEKEKRKTQGHSYRITKKIEEALDSCDSFYRKNRQDLEECTSYFELKKMTEYNFNKMEFDMKIAQNPNSADAYYERGIARNWNDFEASIDDFTKAIILDQNYADAYYKRAFKYSISNDHYNAVQDLTKYIEFDNKNYGAFSARAHNKNKLNDYRGAIIDYSKTIELNPTNFISYERRGECKFSLGDYDGALSDFNKIIEIYPKCSECYFWRAKTKLKLYDKEGACLDFSKAGEEGYAKAYELIRENCN